MSKSLASDTLGVPESALQPFNVLDTFNDNTLEGYISMQRNRMYGAMLILRVGGKDVDAQRVYATPKIKYPFSSKDDGTRVFSWPKTKTVEFYDKYDGTNIFAYSYADAVGARYITFKTRLTPVVKASRFGDFAEMWSDILTSSRFGQAGGDHPVSWPDLLSLVGTGVYGLAFEMTGTRNPHLIKYTKELDAHVLFAVRQEDGAVIAPSQLPLSSQVAECTLRHEKGGLQELADEEMTELYNQEREAARVALRRLDEADIESQFEGSEGRIVYLHTDGGTSLMFKCKPPQIEAIHWTRGSIPEHMILEGVWKYYESNDQDPELEDVLEVLLDDFPLEAINNSMNKIKGAMSRVAERLAFREKVDTIYRTNGLTIEVDGRGAVMRALSPKFDRKEMSDVFNALRELGHVG